MLQIGNKPIDTMYVGGKLVQQVYLGSKKIYPEHGVIPKAIKDAMVLWYDIKRQGATNESMAENPVLRDLSGNGYDATCYNFAWTEQSGISATDYPDALVSDGVDDFAQVLELPLLNREQGYTIIAKRTYLNDTKGCLASYRGITGTSGPFAMELVELNRTDSFGNKNTLKISTPELITWQRKDSYNGVSIFYTGTEFDATSRCLNIFKLNPSGLEYVGQIALYSLIFFNRDLTDEEIEWVKTNLIETEE